MQRKKRALSGLGWVVRQRHMVRLARVAISMAAAGGVAQAAPDSSCQAINSGTLNVEIGTEGSVTRQVALKAGDTLTFNFEADAGPFGSLTLLNGAGAPRSLLVGPSGTRVSFVAAKAGAFDFEFATDGAETASFVISCAPAGSGAGTRPSAAARRGAKLLGGTMHGIENFEIADLAGVALDAGVPVASRGSGPAPAPSALPAASVSAMYAGGVDMKMQWRSERYKAGGPNGLEIDNSASGVEAALNYKVLPEIMVGALAQVDQRGETLVGTQRSLMNQGWMAGPVTNVKLAPNVTLDARAAWGVAESAADELSARSASIARRMVSARLANTQSFGPWRFSPSVNVNHAYEAVVAPGAPHDAAAPYAGGFGRVDVGPELVYRIDLDKAGYIEPRASIGTFWDFESLSRLAPATSGHHDLRLKAEAGVTVGATDGTKLKAAGGVEEGQPGAADIWSGRLQLSVPMQ